VHRLLNVDQKLRRLRLCRDRQDLAERTETHFDGTYGRRTLNLCRDPGTKKQSPLWKSQKYPCSEEGKAGQLTLEEHCLTRSSLFKANI